MNKRFQNALNRIPQKTPPVWFMRQAGRYHKHYQGLRSKYSFMELCKRPDLAAEVALGPIKDFDFDVSILFSDLLFPLEALGMGLKYEDTGPKLGWQLTPQNVFQLKKLKEALPLLEFQQDAVFKTRQLLPKDKSLIGFIGGPWTLFTYAVEGSHKGSLTPTKCWMKALYPEFCKYLVQLLIENIKLQLAGGAEIIMIFDTAAGELSPKIFQDLVENHLGEIANYFPKKIGYYSKGTTEAHLQVLEKIRPHLAGIGVDHRFEMSSLLKSGVKSEVKSGNTGFVQGNFDQSLLFLPKQEFLEELFRYLEPIKNLSIEERAGWVSGLGHGVLPVTPEENVRLFVSTVREVL